MPRCQIRGEIMILLLCIINKECCLWLNVSIVGNLWLVYSENTAAVSARIILTTSNISHIKCSREEAMQENSVY